MPEILDAFLIDYSDSSFTNPHEVVRPDDPAECTGRFTHMGAMYWGFETERHRAITIEGQGFIFDHNAFHHFTIGLMNQSQVSEIRVSTKWFTGNQVPVVSLDLIDGTNTSTSTSTTTVIERATLAPDQDHVFKFEPTQATRCRVRCYHEGGIARVNLLGEPGIPLYEQPNLLEAASISHVSNEHYGSPAMAVAGKRIEDHMIGWESARTGFGEQCVFSFAAPIQVRTLIVDTYLHRLNPPLSCHLFGLFDAELEQAMELQPRYCLKFDDGTQVVPENILDYMSRQQFLTEDVANPHQFKITLEVPAASPWVPLVSFAELSADTWHEMTDIESDAAVKHLLYMHFPNGGVHGLKVFGDTLE